MPLLWGNNHEHVHNIILKCESSLTNLLYCRPINLLNLGNISWKQGKWKFFETIFWLRSTRPQYFVVTIQRCVSCAKFFPLLLSIARTGGTAAYDKFYFLKNIFIRSKSADYIALSVRQFQTWLMWLRYAKMPIEKLLMLP